MVKKRSIKVARPQSNVWWIRVASYEEAGFIVVGSKRAAKSSQSSVKTIY